MDINQFIVKIAELLDEINPTSLSPATNFKELDEWSSLAALSLIAFADEEFGVELTGENIRTAKTIEDLYLLMNKR